MMDASSRHQPNLPFGPNPSQPAVSHHGSGRRSLIRRYPISLFALALAALLSATAVWRFYRLEREVRNTGIAVSESDFLDQLAIPGVYPLYVVGSVTNSAAASWTAFALGMALTYGGIGLAADFVLKLIRRKIPEIKPRHG